MSDKPIINIRQDILQAGLFVMSEDELKKASLDRLEKAVEYWDLWLEGVAGKQIHDLLEMKALAEQLIADKKKEAHEFQKFKQRREALTDPDHR